MTEATPEKGKKKPQIDEGGRFQGYFSQYIERDKEGGVDIERRNIQRWHLLKMTEGKNLGVRQE